MSISSILQSGKGLWQFNYMFTYDVGGNYVARFSLEEQQLYGNKRLGVKKINEELFSEEFTGTLGADIWDYAGAIVGQMYQH